MDDEECVAVTLVNFLGGGVKECGTRAEEIRTDVVVLDVTGWLHVIGETGEAKVVNSWVIDLSVDICSTFHIDQFTGVRKLLVSCMSRSTYLSFSTRSASRSKIMLKDHALVILNEG